MPIVDIPFTQYMLPNGHKVPKVITLDDPDGTLARYVGAILAMGAVFETEVLTNGMVSLTVTDAERGDLFHEIVSNGPSVPVAVARLITKAGRRAEADDWPRPSEDE